MCYILTLFKFDKQFLFFLFQNIFIGICNLIDTAFGNHIDLDSVCVLSAYTIITWVTYATYSIGSYAYRVLLDKAKLCCVLQIATGILLGAVLYACNSVVSHMYSLTDNQYVLFESCLKVHALWCPVLAFREFLGNYAEYRCYNKQALSGNIILYGSMIITDVLVIYFGGSLTELVWFTGLCSLIYSVYMFIVLDFRKEKFCFSKLDAKLAFKHGWNTCFDRITGKVATVCYNIYASKLGTELYAVHSVCYAIGVFTENFTNALLTYEVISLVDKKQDKFKHCVAVAKKYSVFIVVSSYFVCYLLLLFTHGTVSITDCLLYTALYCTEIFALLLYEPMKAYLLSEGCTNYLKFGGVIGIFVRIPLVVIGYYLNLGLFPFALSCTFDFGVRGLYFYLMSKKVRRLKLKR